MIVVSSLPITFSSLKIGRGIDKFNGLDQLLKSDVRIELVVGNHFRFIDPRKWLKGGVFQQAGGPDSNRDADLFNQGAKVTQDVERQFSALERMGDLIIGLI